MIYELKPILNRIYKAFPSFLEGRKTEDILQEWINVLWDFRTPAISAAVDDYINGNRKRPPTPIDIFHLLKDRGKDNYAILAKAYREIAGEEWHGNK